MRRLLLLAPLLLAPLLLALGCGGATSAPPPPPPPPPPNLLLIVIDCLRGDALSAAGYERPTTPHLDALAAEGALFRNAFAPASWTRPSLPSLLTGLYPSEHGLLDLGDDKNDDAPALAASVVTIGERLTAGGYATAMFGEQHKLSPQFGLGQGFARWEHRTGGAANIQKKLLDWSAGLQGRRWFAYLHYLELHWPYCPPEGVRGRFYSGPSTLEPCAQWRKLRDRMRNGDYRPSADDTALLRARYDEELVAVDAALGNLFAQLRQRGQWDDTLVVVTADHGEEFGEHGGFFHGHSLFDELIHVPLLIKPPAAWTARRGARVEALAEVRDIPATLLDAAGLGDPPRDSHSLLPWVRSEPAASGSAPPAPRAYAVSESMDQVAVRSREWKLVADKGTGRLALFDLRRDPGETRDVAAAHPREVAALRRQLVTWRDGLVPAERSAVDVDEETRKGLENLGYVQ